jgi:hypothetical protein
MSYIQLYSQAGAEPAPLPEGVSAERAHELGYVIVAPKPTAGHDEEVYWNGHAWAARPAPTEGEGA